MSQRKSSAAKAALSMMLFKGPIGIGLFRCMGRLPDGHLDDGWPCELYSEVLQ